MVESLFFEIRMDTDDMVGLNLYRNEVHVLLVALQINGRESIVDENLIERLEYLVIVSTVLLRVVSRPDQTWVKNGSLIKFELRDVEQKASNVSDCCCHEVIFS